MAAAQFTVHIFLRLLVQYLIIEQSPDAAAPAAGMCACLISWIISDCIFCVTPRLALMAGGAMAIGLTTAWHHWSYYFNDAAMLPDRLILRNAQRQ